MFITLLAVTFIVSVVVCIIIVKVFSIPIDKILERLVADDISKAWSRYVMFAIYVVGISGGVRVWDLEKYIAPAVEGKEALILTGERWTLEIYRTVIGTLQSVAWMLLLFFMFALIAYVVVRGLELRRQPKS